ncbi:MAG: class I SAM-dependent methyltransferase [Acidimicrobiales bacterium]
MNRVHREFLASAEWARILETDLLPWIDQVADLGDDVLEIGPGPGRTTDLLRQRTAKVTAVEIDDSLAAALAERLAGTNVDVIHADAAKLALPSGRFSSATCSSTLHHVPSATAQDRVLSEIHRVLQPGAALFATDARDLDAIRALHDDDTFVPLDDETVVSRLEAAGFPDVDLEILEYEIRFVARKP